MEKLNLQQYFKESQAKGIFEHTVRATDNGDDVLFYIHPQNANGETLDFAVKGNELKQLHISPEEDYRQYLMGAMQGRSMEQLREVAKVLGV